MTVGDVYDYLDVLAPFRRQDKRDNSGRLTGESGARVEKILVCLDVTVQVAAEAALCGANLIVAHHPVIFEPLKKIVKGDLPYTLIQNGISVIAAHTNLDISDGGVTDAALECLGFPKSYRVIEPVNDDGSGYGKITELEHPVFAGELAEMCKKAFGCTVVRYVDGKKPIKRVGLTSGSGSSLVAAAFDAGCGAFIAGDIKWDRFVFAANNGFTLIDAGHFHTENMICAVLRDRIKSRFPEADVSLAKSNTDICGYC
ncbi:MAG: Nif3-like dinuclear metal center hexameric protein [Oscillospiraceae bacterium]|jgi:dinuclear metal center YbgI/SA1388 family protein|nr:Nif3-like dinuclear metal center hexameric protein [Oscillospiraceae bacterium]